MTIDLSMSGDNVPDITTMDESGVTSIDPVTLEGLFINGHVMGSSGKPLFQITALGEGNRSYRNTEARRTGFPIQWEDGTRSHDS
jgi:hypothetical protein